MASPAIDGNAFASSTTAASSISKALTTTGSSDLIVAFVIMRNATTTPPTVSSVTAAGLTFTQRSSVNYVNAGNTVRGEVWTAVASSALSTETITASLSSNSTGTGLLVFGVSGQGSSPFDPNASLPATDTFTAANPSVTITTSNADDLLLWFLFGPGSISGSNPWAPAGFTFVGGSNIGGLDFAIMSSKSVSTIQTAQAFTFTTGESGGLIFDAVTADGAPPVAPPFDPRRNRTYLRR